MEGEQFSLCWNNFHSNLSSGFHSLLKDEDLVDVTLAAEGKFLKAHKTVLSVCSPFFKDLFRVNPCKHPIVILPEVNYASLCSLLHFMYQGEVSVSQEEIPTFMRVAEMLKVKGLTDNAATDIANGLASPGRSYQDQRNIMKRPRPVKKLIRPLQPLRPLESPKVEKSPPPQPPPPKRQHLDSESTPSTSPVAPIQNQIKEFQEPLLRPKEEPIDQSEDDRASEEMNLDIANMLDTTLSEPSSGRSFQGWPNSGGTTSDSVQPGGALTLLKSGRGQYVLIHNGHIYTVTDKKDSRQFWVCVKKKTLNCEGCVTTLPGPVLLSYSGHNHPQMHDVITRLQVPSCSISPELRLQ